MSELSDDDLERYRRASEVKADMEAVPDRIKRCRRVQDKLGWGLNQAYEFVKADRDLDNPLLDSMPDLPKPAVVDGTPWGELPALNTLRLRAVDAALSAGDDEDYMGAAWGFVEDLVDGAIDRDDDEVVKPIVVEVGRLLCNVLGLPPHTVHAVDSPEFWVNVQFDDAEPETPGALVAGLIVNGQRWSEIFPYDEDEESAAAS